MKKGLNKMSEKSCLNCIHWMGCISNLNADECNDYKRIFDIFMIENILKETYFEVANYDVSKLPKSDSDKLSVIAGEFRRIMVNKLRDY
jgi:hypothetical protein